MSQQNIRPLSGIRVLDFTAFVAGPYCTRLMADLGADVVKVEPPHGDLLRAVSPGHRGHSTYFGQLNLGKRSLSIDLKNPNALAVVTRLAARADVLVEKFSSWSIGALWARLPVSITTTTRSRLLLDIRIRSNGPSSK